MMMEAHRRPLTLRLDRSHCGVTPITVLEKPVGYILGGAFWQSNCH